MKTKICSKCGEEKSIIEYAKDKTHKDGLSSQCKNCRNFHQYKYTKKWRMKNKDKHVQYSIAYQKKYPNKRRQKEKRQHQNLINSYVKQLLSRRTNLSALDIPIELVELKREHIKLGRLLKGIQNEDNQGSKREAG